MIGRAVPGNVSVVVTNNGGHPPQVWAKMALDEIIGVSLDAPRPIRDQAIAYKDQIHEILLKYMKAVAQAERDTFACR